tara:strand:- start:696 stop:1220 length:525 start_codon:yes stop_codon:yes gene_type:complete
MPETLIIYSSTDGHTKTICLKILNSLNNPDLVKIISLEKAETFDLSKYEKIIIGASIRYGKHNKKVYNFVKKNIDLFYQKKTAFFSVNATARKPEKNSPNTNPYVIKFLRDTNWKPNKVGVFAGKVDYPNYNFINKNVIRFIMMMTKGPIDTKNSYEFTNWDNVRKFALELNNI